LDAQPANCLYFQEFCAARRFDDGAMATEDKLCLWLVDDLLLRRVPPKNTAPGLKLKKRKKKGGDGGGGGGGGGGRPSWLSLRQVYAGRVRCGRY
jgi:hypothetical protein